MTLAAERLIDWTVARAVGDRVAGRGGPIPATTRARLLQDFSELVPQAEDLVTAFTGIAARGYRARPWVMSRSQWLQANLRAFETVMEPFAKKVLGGRTDRAASRARRAALGAQVGGLLGYMSRRVLGQYDLFLPPDDDGLLYFVGPNVHSVERRHGFAERDFRLWISLHEVAHRVQFGGSPWLKGHLSGLVNAYLSSVEIDPGWLVQQLRRALEEARSGTTERGFGWIFLLMTPDQRDLVRKMQAAMALLEGHGNFVMDQVAGGRIRDAGRFRRRLHERRHRGGPERVVQKAIGFDVKARQYDLGERFVSLVVDRVGMERFNLVWASPSTLPTMEEITRPEAWVARVAA